MYPPFENVQHVFQTFFRIIRSFRDICVFPDKIDILYISKTENTARMYYVLQTYFINSK